MGPPATAPALQHLWDSPEWTPGSPLPLPGPLHLKAGLVLPAPRPGKQTVLNCFNKLLQNDIVKTMVLRIFKTEASRNFFIFTKEHGQESSSSFTLEHGQESSSSFTMEYGQESSSSSFNQEHGQESSSFTLEHGQESSSFTFSYPYLTNICHLLKLLPLLSISFISLSYP